MDNEIQTHGPLVMNVALGFVMLSPVLTLLIGFVGAWLFAQLNS
jgi:hypothetical protein